MIWKKQHPNSLLERMISLVTSISQITTLLQTQYNEQTNLVDIVEQLLIDFNPRSLRNNRCRNGQDYDYHVRL